MEEEQPHDFTPPDEAKPSWETDFGQNSFAAPEPPAAPLEPPSPVAEEPSFFTSDATPPPVFPPEDITADAASAHPKPERAPMALPGWLKSMSLGGLLRWALGLSLLGWVYTNCHPDLPTGLLAERYAFPESKFVPVEGMDVHCRMIGRGETLLLLHDANSSMHTWSGWAAELAPKYRLISVDLPGFGLTGPHPQGSYSTFMYHAFLDSLVHQLRLSKFHLAGNGLGAEIAWFYAAERPAGLDKLILLDAPGLEHHSAAEGWVNWLARTPVLNRVLWSVTPRSYVRLMLEDIYADDAQVTDSLVQRHFDLLLAPGN
ncbi:MAG TPA: alpha/beta fold hydrolase, partial [Saprospiraceae bacterium]|nr:alpha/beta fold hydrolase [Saprospiraceae bacterium]